MSKFQAKTAKCNKIIIIILWQLILFGYHENSSSFIYTEASKIKNKSFHSSVCCEKRCPTKPTEFVSLCSLELTTMNNSLCFRLPDCLIWMKTQLVMTEKWRYTLLNKKCGCFCDPVSFGLPVWEGQCILGRLCSGFGVLRCIWCNSVIVCTVDALWGQRWLQVTWGWLLIWHVCESEKKQKKTNKKKNVTSTLWEIDAES